MVRGVGVELVVGDGAGDGWEGGATALPATKKSLEWALVAVVAWMRLLSIGLLVAARANVCQSDVDTRTDLVGAALGAPLDLVELDANILRLHVGSRDAVDKSRGELFVRVAGSGASTSSSARRVGRA